jgi:hypothetical protein
MRGYLGGATALSGSVAARVTRAKIVRSPLTIPIILGIP